MLGVIVDDIGSVGVSQSSSSGSVDNGPRLDERGSMDELCVRVDSGMASGIEPTRLAGDDRYADEGVRCGVEIERRASVDSVYGDESQSVDPSGEWWLSEGIVGIVPSCVNPVGVGDTSPGVYDISLSTESGEGVRGRVGVLGIEGILGREGDPGREGVLGRVGVLGRAGVLGRVGVLGRDGVWGDPGTGGNIGEPSAVR